jgi:hypothetical protein
MRVRYVAGFFGGYTESGSTADLVVADRTTQDIEESGEFKLTDIASLAGADQLLTSIYGGVLGLASDTTVQHGAARRKPFVRHARPEPRGGCARRLRIRTARARRSLAP